MSRVSPLAPPQLRAACPEEALDFETTDELEDLIGVIGQDRALEAFDVGLGIRREGYNIVIIGSQGVGKHTVARAALKARAATEPCPPDLCYVFNFAEPHRPVSMLLPAGKGGRFRTEMDKLVEDLRMILQVVFTSDRYSQRVRRIVEAMEKVQEQSLDAIKKVAAGHGLAVEDSEDGFSYGPEQDGAIMPPEDFDKLEEDARERFDAAMADVEDRLQALTAAVPRWRKETRDRLKSLEQEVTREEVGRLLEPLRERWADNEPVATWLDALAVDVVKQVHLFRDHDESEEGPPGPPMLNHGAASLKRYAVNLLIDNAFGDGAPVIYEDNPVLTNLVGRIEHVSEFGALVTDHTLIKPGALHRASGGYLILDAHRVLGEPFAWTALKRALRARLLRMDAPSHEATLQTTVSLAPEPVPTDVKVVLLGSPELYYELYSIDPEFERHFKILAAFEEQIPWTVEHTRHLARLIGTKARTEGLKPFSRAAVAEMVVGSSREVEDAEFLSANLSRLFNLMDESDYWAEKRGASVVDEVDVTTAIAAFERRSSQPRDELHRQIERGTFMVATDGEATGQINGLAIINLGNYEFGRPTRITATARMGSGEVVDIERESELSGSIHSKGVLILHAFLGSRYATDVPLSLAASLVFEQSYGFVEGDSASLAELCALLSATAQLPIRQSLAVTGSINQHGQVQAIGGVNSKIEGFFDICRARGLTGEQGVIIPAANAKNLMLRADVVEAAAAGVFHVYAVDTIEPALELLMELPAGLRDDDGHYPPDTVNGRVEAALRAFYHRRRTLAAGLRGTADQRL